MPLMSLRQLMDHAQEYDYGVPAFNVNNMETLMAIMNAAAQTDSPVIVQASRGARNYANDIMLRRMIEAAMEIYPEIPVAVHQDHGNNLSVCASALYNGFTSVMMDGSLEEDGKTPASFDYNVNITGKVAEVAHSVGASCEGELGCLGSLETGSGAKEDGHGFEGTLDRDSLLTDPGEAAEFVKQTHVDALAVAIGTSHGAYKFTRRPTGDILAMERIKEINARIPNTPLVMHGSSAVPQEYLEIINEYGGEMPETYGVPVEECKTGIKNGVRKINIDTDCRLAVTGQVRKVLAEKKAEFDPRKFLKPAMEEMQKLCAQRYEEFGTAGKASKIKPIKLEEMAKRYASGELDPKVK